MNALEFATKAHEGQFRWDGITPYIEHPIAVAELLKSWKIDQEQILQVAYLHDVLEDTDVTEMEIISEFGLAVANYVSELTRPKDADYFEHCKKMSRGASLVKVADILCNITDLTSKKSPKFVNKRLFALSILQKKTQELMS